MVLKELGLTYESVYLDFAKQEHKAPEFTKYNPNGRIPALIDHKNGDFVIWESSAILLYLVDKYDTEKKLTVTDDNERYSMIQWLFFQASGQGYDLLLPIALRSGSFALYSPYFGQAFWYMRFHHEQLPSVIKRFQDETLRVFGVLDSVLKEREWLVGGKCTIADLAFVNWNYRALDYSIKEVCDPEKQFPHFYAYVSDSFIAI